MAAGCYSIAPPVYHHGQHDASGCPTGPLAGAGTRFGRTTHTRGRQAILNPPTHPNFPLTPLALARLAYASDSQRALACTFKGSSPAQRRGPTSALSTAHNAPHRTCIFFCSRPAVQLVSHTALCEASCTHYHLPRLAAAWGSEITGSGLSSPFPLLRSTKPYSDRAENFEANTHPYRIPPLLSSHTHLPPHLSSTGVF